MKTLTSSGLKFEELVVGQFAETTITATENDVVKFAEISGDHNPIHLSPGYAAKSPFGGRIVHGALIGAYISALIGMKLPGPGAVVVSLTLKFRGPVKLGATVTVRVEVTALDPKRAFARLACVCSVAGAKVIKGEALIYVPRVQNEDYAI